MTNKFWIAAVCVGLFMLASLTGACSKEEVSQIGPIDERLVGGWSVEIPENLDYSFYHFEFTNRGGWSAEADMEFGTHTMHDTVTTGYGDWKVKNKTSDNKIEISVTRHNPLKEVERLKNPPKDWVEYKSYTIEFLSENEIKMGKIAMQEGFMKFGNFTVRLKRIE